jgi:hypothetical protein
LKKKYYKNTHFHVQKRNLICFSLKKKWLGRIKHTKVKWLVPYFVHFNWSFLEISLTLYHSSRAPSFLVVGNIFRLETCMYSLVKVSPYSKLNFQGEIFFTQNWCNITLSKIISLSNDIKLVFYCPVNIPLKLWQQLK